MVVRTRQARAALTAMVAAQAGSARMNGLGSAELGASQRDGICAFHAHHAPGPTLRSECDVRQKKLHCLGGPR